MKRKIYKNLLNWKENSINIPLMIIGARQIGKTYIIKDAREILAEQIKNNGLIELTY